MGEQVRKIEFTLTVDTNKRTMHLHGEADNLDGILDDFRECVSDVRWSL